VPWRKALVSTIAGNKFSGDQRLRNGYPWVMTVTAGTVDRWFAGTITLGNGESIIGWSIFHDFRVSYDATPQDYVNLLCSMNFNTTQILTFVRSNSYMIVQTLLLISIIHHLWFYSIKIGHQSFKIFKEL
jgi:hypothetical protein